jgi:hypothetical protein
MQCSKQHPIRSLIGPRQQRRRTVARHRCGLVVDDQFELGHLPDLGLRVWRPSRNASRRQRRHLGKYRAHPPLQGWSVMPSADQVPVKTAHSDNALARAILLASAMSDDLGRPPLFSKRISEATRLSDDPQCCWQPPRRRLPSRGVLVCRHFRFFRQVADMSPPRAGDNHPNPCMPLCVRPLLIGPGR